MQAMTETTLTTPSQASDQAPSNAARILLVTGASRGIGHMIAQTLAAEGMKLVVAARSRESAC